MSSTILNNLNELFLNYFPDNSGAETDIITADKSRFHNQPSALNPEFDIKTAKMILGYPDHLESEKISDRLDKLLWEYYEIFKFISIPPLKVRTDYTVIFPLLDLFDMAWNERNTSLSVRGLTTKTELNGDCVSWLAEEVMDAIDKRFDYWELDMGCWWNDTVATRQYLKELSNAIDVVDEDHLCGYYAYNLLEHIDWDKDTILTDRSIFVYRILCVIGFADDQDLRILDAEPTNGVLRKNLSEFVRNKIKSYLRWVTKNSKL